MEQQFDKPLNHTIASSDLDRLAFSHPEEVVTNPLMSIADKRAILASWASDAHAVPNAPTLRQLDNGAIVTLDTILNALRNLDGQIARQKSTGALVVWRPSGVGARDRLLMRWRRKSSWSRHRGDDDDTPPPCPSGAAIPVGVRLALASA